MDFFVFYCFLEVGFGFDWGFFSYDLEMDKFLFSLFFYFVDEEI